MSSASAQVIVEVAETRPALNNSCKRKYMHMIRDRLEISIVEEREKYSIVKEKEKKYSIFKEIFTRFFFAFFERDRGNQLLQLNS